MRRHRKVEIVFERVERDCEANRRARQKARNRRLIYDFNVIINGEHRATLVPVFGRGYQLCDPDRRPLHDWSGNPIELVKKQSDFMRFVRGQLVAYRIPTPQTMVLRREREAARARLTRAAAEKAARARIVAALAPELLATLKLALPFLEDEVALSKKAKALIAEAETSGADFERAVEHELWTMRRKELGITKEAAGLEEQPGG